MTIMPRLVKSKYELCCQAMASGENQATSYRAGGFIYSSASATRFFQRPDIAARVNEIIAERHGAEAEARKIGIQKAGLTEEWIIERLKYLTEVSLRGQPVLDANGVQIPGQFTGRRDGATAARCLELAAKIKGLNIQRIEVGDPGDFARLPDDKLDAEIDAMAQELGFKRSDLQPKGVTEH